VYDQKSPDENVQAVIKMVISDPTLNEFRCGGCGMLLLRGRNLEKALIEVKCPRCKSLVINSNKIS